MISSLLEYAKRHDITIGDSAKLCYTQDGVLYLERTEDTQPKPPAREPRIRAQIYRPRMAYAPNTNS